MPAHRPSSAGDPASTTVAVGTLDLAGNARFSNGQVDMGAYEFQGAGIPPISFSVQGSGTATCASSPTITLSGSQTGVSYQLQRDGATTGSAVVGTGSALSFGPQSLSGTYTVLATSTSGCTAVMATSATVVSNTVAASVSVTPSSGTLSCASPMGSCWPLAADGQRPRLRYRAVGPAVTRCWGQPVIVRLTAPGCLW